MSEQLKPLTTDIDKLNEIAAVRGIVAATKTFDEFAKARIYRMIDLAHVEMIARRGLQNLNNNRDEALKFFEDAWKDEPKEKLVERMTFINEEAQKNFHQVCKVEEAVIRMMESSPEDGIDGDIAEEINKHSAKLMIMMKPVTKLVTKPLRKLRRRR